MAPARTVTVDSPVGRITGTATDGVATFYSIPFAEFPDPFGPATALPKTTHEREIDATSPRPDDVALTITAPEGTRFGADLPVVVYIHGGRFEHGSHIDEMVTGEHAARAGFIQVNLGYRLGLSGFLPFEKDTPGTYRGTDDLQLGLEWVQRTIESFGGDPTNVTLVGQSAGAAAALWLARKDHYRGGFRRVWAASPCFPRGDIARRKSTLRTLLSAPVTRASLGILHATKPEKLRRAYDRARKIYGTDLFLGPWPYDPEELADVPLVVTATREEFHNLPTARDWDAKPTPPTLRLKALARFMGMGKDRFGFWRDRASRPQLAGQLVTDAVCRRFVVDTANARPQAHVATFVRSAGTKEALHCDDLPFLFGRSSNEQAVHAISGLLLGFARGRALPWPKYGEGHVIADIDLTTGHLTLNPRSLDHVAAAMRPLRASADAAGLGLGER